MPDWFDILNSVTGIETVWDDGGTAWDLATTIWDGEFEQVWTDMRFPAASWSGLGFGPAVWTDVTFPEDEE